MSNENNASFALGIIFGAFVGAVAGVLLAPIRRRNPSKSERCSG